VELRFAHWLPAQHSLAKTGFEPWAKSVEAASGGSIKVTLFPAQQLGKAPDHYDMARDGIADMTWVSRATRPGASRSFAASELPFLMAKPGGGSAALDAWYRKYAGTEMKDVKLCMAHMHNGTLHSKKPSPSRARSRA
jgi:TRAP-type C4-dicarboxylate transport system substrate-binding protein